MAFITVSWLPVYHRLCIPWILVYIMAFITVSWCFYHITVSHGFYRITVSWLHVYRHLCTPWGTCVHHGFHHCVVATCLPSPVHTIENLSIFTTVGLVCPSLLKYHGFHYSVVAICLSSLVHAVGNFIDFYHCRSFCPSRLKYHGLNSSQVQPTLPQAPTRAQTFTFGAVDHSPHSHKLPPSSPPSRFKFTCLLYGVQITCSTKTYQIRTRKS